MEGFGCTLASTIAISFVVDSYRSEAGSTLTTLNFAKNLLGTFPISNEFTQYTSFSMHYVLRLMVGFIFSFVTNKAIDNIGVRTTFLIFGAIQIGLCGMAVPMYLFGKRARGWSHRRKANAI